MSLSTTSTESLLPGTIHVNSHQMHRGCNLRVLALFLLFVIVIISLSSPDSFLFSQIKKHVKEQDANKRQQQATNYENLQSQKAASKVRPPYAAGLIPLSTREDIPLFLNQQPNLRVGAELGVERGLFAEMLLRGWVNCQKFYLIDIWAPTTNLDRVGTQVPGSNVTHMQNMKETGLRLAPFSKKIDFLRSRTDQAFNRFKNTSLDFIYLDARHDYCAVLWDLRLWYPKLTKGGIIAGNNYRAHEMKDAAHDYELCEDGRREKGGVKRAVDEFALTHSLAVVTTYKDKNVSFMMRKPFY